MGKETLGDVSNSPDLVPHLLSSCNAVQEKKDTPQELIQVNKLSNTDLNHMNTFECRTDVSTQEMIVKYEEDCATGQENLAYVDKFLKNAIDQSSNLEEVTTGLKCACDTVKCVGHSKELVCEKTKYECGKNTNTEVNNICEGRISPQA